MAVKARAAAAAAELELQTFFIPLHHPEFAEKLVAKHIFFNFNSYRHGFLSTLHDLHLSLHIVKSGLGLVELGNQPRLAMR
jgi:hypothetical protein